jgi:hypothetical protein
MNVSEYKPIFTIGHYVTIWIFIAGLILSGLSMGNEMENQQIQTQVRQEAIMIQQAEIKKDVKDAKKEQQAIKELLIQIKTNQER